MAWPAFDIGKLSTEQRLQLIEELWESIGSEERERLPLTSEQQEELDRRLDALEREGSVGISSDQLFDRIRKRSS
jgi:putative addiction module component (TIGR02574 family)